MAASFPWSTYGALRLGLITLLWAGQSIADFTPKYCATINTASTSANYSDFQSNGLCDTFCNGYSYAVLQDHACWCSNYTPSSSTTVDLDECDSPCPGFPDDDCGSAPNLYIYLFKFKSPSGTNGPSSIIPTTTQSGMVVSTITTGGVVQTVTIAPDGTPMPTTHGLSTATVVGIALGAAFAALLVGGILFFVWWRKRKEKQALIADPSPRSSSAGIVSTMASMAEAGQQPGTRRGSKFIPIDDRMEFHHGLYARGDANISGESVNSLRDNVDYSRRVLRPTNPDPGCE